MRYVAITITLLGLVGLPSLALTQDDGAKKTEEAKTTPPAAPDAAKTEASKDAPKSAETPKVDAPTGAADPMALQARIDKLEAQLKDLSASCTPPPGFDSVQELARRVRAMKSQSAASVLAQLDERLALEIFTRLDRRSSARILNVMPTPQAAKLLNGMAKRGAAP